MRWHDDSSLLMPFHAFSAFDQHSYSRSITINLTIINCFVCSLGMLLWLSSMDAWYSELNEKKLCYNPRSGKWRSGEFAESQLEDCVVYFYLSSRFDSSLTWIMMIMKIQIMLIIFYISIWGRNTVLGAHFQLNWEEIHENIIVKIGSYLLLQC